MKRVLVFCALCIVATQSDSSGAVNSAIGASQFQCLTNCNLVEYTDTTISFSGSNTGTATFVASVPIHDGDSLEHMYMTYENDYDTTGDEYHVKLYLYYQNVSTGAVGYYGPVVSRQNLKERLLNDWADATADVDTYAYFFKVSLKRTGTFDDPTFYSAQLY